MEFIDTDSLIVKKAGMEIPEIFAKHGEEYFRELETEVLKEVGVLTGKIIATGGGVVKNERNYFPLKQNSKIFLIERDIDKLASNGRPLSKDADAIKQLFLERKDKYLAFADVKIDNNGEVNNAVQGVIDLL